MIKVVDNGFYLSKGRELIEDTPDNHKKLEISFDNASPERARQETMAAQILLSHNVNKPLLSGGTKDAVPAQLHLNFDALASHDITYVNIIQTARASGLESFPVPYILTNCHNSLCAVGGTINADDHLFGLSAARRYGGIFVPPHIAVIHSYIRETTAAPGKMILGSDSHTRYGFLGTLGVGEGGGELVKQLLGQSYDVPYPKVIAVYLTGKPRLGVGPQDVALALIGEIFKSGFAKNAVLEFVGDGIAYLSADYRAGIDVMTTETACWSSIWETDDKIEQYMGIHYRDDEFKRITPGELAYYDGLIHVDLASIKPMIALPFHPSNVYEIDTFLQTPTDMLREVEKQAEEFIDNPNIKLNLTQNVTDKGVRVDQAVIAGCAGGTFDNLMAVRAVIGAHGCSGGEGNEGFNFTVYPGSQPIFLELAENGSLSSLIGQGVIVRSAFCGPCFGAGDVPANNGLSIRHTTRNFPNREGSKPNEGQMASVCLMDSRSIAASALNGGYIASAEPLGRNETTATFHFGVSPYLARVYNGVGKPDKNAELRFGPNIVDWPAMEGLKDDLLLKIVSFITDPVTTTDELIPSGETSSFRSNPIGLAEYTLSRKDPAYVGRAKEVREAAAVMRQGSGKTAGKAASKCLPELNGILTALTKAELPQSKELQLASALFACKPGDGSAREQAASCQRVLGGLANFANEYATKRYRSNLINWGILPFIVEGEPCFKNNDYVYIPGIANALCEKAAAIMAYVINPAEKEAKPFTLKLPELSADERDLILAGSLINLNRGKIKGKNEE